MICMESLYVGTVPYILYRDTDRRDTERHRDIQPQRDTERHTETQPQRDTATERHRYVYNV